LGIFKNEFFVFFFCKFRHISKNRKATAMNEHGLNDNEAGAAGPSTSAKKMKQ